MFGRRPQPHVFPMFSHDPAKLAHDKSIFLSLGIIICSVGPGIAKDLFVTIVTNSKPPNCKVDYRQDDSENWIAHSLLSFRKSLISKPDLRMASDATIQPLTIFISIAPPFNADFTFEIVSGCGQSPPTRIILGCDKDKLDALYKEFKDRASDETGAINYGLDFSRRILNLADQDILLE